VVIVSFLRSWLMLRVHRTIRCRRYIGWTEGVAGPQAGSAR
jgi:hypothetical protein